MRQSLGANDIARLVLVNGHGGNYVLANIVQQASVTAFRMALFPGRDDWSAARHFANMETTSHEDMHAGELETSIMLHACPELVRGNYDVADHAANDRQHLLSTGMRAYTDSGVIGRPSAASPDKGKALLDSLTASFADHQKLLLDKA